ncbi:MAG: hypothetical protein U1A16_02500 [Patescibacteria group bacterium]|nr:hypothetical protein [Patescibacteria group bacterium]
MARLEVFGRASSFLHDASLNYRRQAPRVWRRIVEVWRVLAEKDGAPTDLEVRLKEFSNFLSLYHFDRSNAELALAVERFFRCLVPIAQERAWRESLRQRRVRSADTIWL